MQPLMQAAQIAPRLVDQIDELEPVGEVPERSDSNNFAKEAEALFLELVEEQ
jgi:hypothetical protein